MNSYTSLVEQLPPPSWDQTVRFARFVSSAPSWYKNLPVHPQVPFYFYLDPGAGMNYIDTPKGEVALLEITDNDPKFHCVARPPCSPQAATNSSSAFSTRRRS